MERKETCVPPGQNLCACGCGELAGFYKYDHSKRNERKGEPKRFIVGHQARGENNGKWNGGRQVSRDGYISVAAKDHPMACVRGTVPEHRIVVEGVLGRRLRPNEIIHHIDHDRANNTKSNLVVCQDHAYHRLLHKREDALNACGNPNFLRCRICGKHDDLRNMVYLEKYNAAYHKECNRVAAALQRKRVKAK